MANDQKPDLSRARPIHRGQTGTGAAATPTPVAMWEGLLCDVRCLIRNAVLPGERRGHAARKLRAVRHRGVSGLSFSVRNVSPETIRGLLPEAREERDDLTH